MKRSFIPAVLALFAVVTGGVFAAPAAGGSLYQETTFLEKHTTTFTPSAGEMSRHSASLYEETSPAIVSLDGVSEAGEQRASTAFVPLRDRGMSTRPASDRNYGPE